MTEGEEDPDLMRVEDIYDANEWHYTMLTH